MFFYIVIAFFEILVARIQFKTSMHEAYEIWHSEDILLNGANF